MRKAILIAAGLLAGLYASGQRLVLNYDRPASKFEEALPIGNGHLGAMVYGGVADDLIWLNEGTLWGGSANPDNNPVPTGGPELLAKVRATLEKEDWSGAEELVKGLQGKYVNSFLPMGSLHLRQTFGTDKGQATNYSGTIAPAQKLSQEPGIVTLTMNTSSSRSSMPAEGQVSSTTVWNIQGKCSSRTRTG